MIELEILVEVFSSYDNALDELKKFDYIQENLTEDIYYIDPLRGTLLPQNCRLNASFRLRSKGCRSYITFKKDHFQNDKWLYSDELETEIGDFVTGQQILEQLGFKKLVNLKNLKRVYKYQSYEIVLEKVEGLGVFLEVELKEQIKESEVVERKAEIQEFINLLNLSTSSELNCGKPELFLRRHHNL